MGKLSHFGTFLRPVDAFSRSLKTKAFIYQKSLDTPVFRLIRFRQKVLTESKSLRWNYSPLKEEAALLPGGLFICASRLME
jgi:hypothetical protein